MARTNLNIRVDEDIKKQAEDLLAGLGMNMTTAINVFLRQVISKGGVPFEITNRTDGFYNEYNQRRLDKAITDLRDGKGTVHELIETDNA